MRGSEEVKDPLIPIHRYFADSVSRGFLTHLAIVKMQHFADSALHRVLSDRSEFRGSFRAATA